MLYICDRPVSCTATYAGREYFYGVCVAQILVQISENIQFDVHMWSYVYEEIFS